MIIEEFEFTKKQIKEYLKDPNKCPICKGLLLEKDAFNDNAATVLAYCKNCKIYFYEIYGYSYKKSKFILKEIERALL